MGLRAPLRVGDGRRSHCTVERAVTVGPMLGAAVIVIVMLLLGPFVLFVGGALWSAFVGRALVIETDRPSGSDAQGA